MILAPIGPITAYRMHTPRWAGTPTSGAGAGAHGGRANRPGTDALYLALDIETAVREYQQASPLMRQGHRRAERRFRTVWMPIKIFLWS